MSNRSEIFGRLLKGAINSIAIYEGKTAPIIEEELGAKIGLASTSLQRYKAGHLPPDPRTVEIIAEAAVRRGFLHREWLQRFLHAARYPNTDTLLDQLCPIKSAHPRPPRVYQNLPAPTYSQFIMREEAFAEVLDGLRQRSAAVMIVGLGGNGKTSLAREIADHCLKSDGSTALFDAAVWVSDKDRPGTTNLSIVLDEIARTLDYPGFTQFEHDEKRREVEQLLRRQRVLICIDNFETVTDGALLAWLLKLPEPSKTLITTREYRREYRRGGWPVELRGMSEGEARALVDERLKVLRILKLVTDQTQVDPLIAATGGNPKAIEVTLGLVKYEHRPLHQVVDDLYTARGELFDDLFTRAWALLDETARRVLLTMTLFPASASGEALSITADVEGYSFERAVEWLADLALLDLHQIDWNSLPRYTLHPLVRAFAWTKMREQDGLETRIRSHWLDYLQNFAQQHTTSSWNESHQRDLDLLEQEIANLHAALQYCADTGHWEGLNVLVFTLNRVWSFRGYYEDRRRFVELALRAADREGKMNEQIRLLCIKARTLCYLDEPLQALDCCVRARQLLSCLVDPPSSLEQNINYSQIRACLLLRDLEQVHILAQRNISISESLRTKTMYSYDLAEYQYEVSHYLAAQQLLTELLNTSIEINDSRGALRAWLLLGRISMEHGEFDQAEEYLDLAEKRAAELHHRRLAAEVMRASARLHRLRRDLSSAHEALDRAIDLFERLGMRRELAEAREELRRLDMGEMPAS